MEAIRYLELKNGLRIVFMPMPGAIVHCGVTVNAGSAHEEEHQHGMAHLIEHLIFKGTKKRKAFHILNRIDSVGGELNAFTAKEETCIYASCLTRYFDRALELLADICGNSTFPAEEIIKEKDVITDEINSYLDSPGEQIFDDFEEQLFPGKGVGRSILGTTKSLKGINRKAMLDFYRNNYVASKTVLSIVGPVSEKEILATAEKYFGHWATGNDKTSFPKPKQAKPFEHRINRSGFQAHAVVGSRAYGVHHTNRIAMVLLNNLLGGPSMNSRLNLNIRERYGITYHLESSYTPYHNTGVFTIYLGTDVQHLDKTLTLVDKELKKLRDEKLGSLQLKRAQEQLKGNISLGHENRVNLMTAIGKSVLTFGKVTPMEELFKKIDRISAEQLHECANAVFAQNDLSRTIYLPQHDNG